MEKIRHCYKAFNRNNKQNTLVSGKTKLAKTNRDYLEVKVTEMPILSRIYSDDEHSE